MAQESAELLLEIGCEEIPASFMRDALLLLKTSLLEQLTEARLSYGEADTYGTPRRMIVHVLAVQTHQSPEERTVRGPAKRACFDAEGKPTQALMGFARSQGVEPDRVQFTGTPGSEYAIVQVHDLGRPALEVLSEAIPAVIRNMTFPKMLYWGEAQMRFARPLRWLLALLGGQVIPFEVAKIQSGNRTRGHRFLSPGELEVHSAKEFFTRLREACVVYDPEERKRIIAEGVHQLVQTIDAKALISDALVEENVFLTEYPRLLIGSFPYEFLDLPASLLTSTMQKHEKFFPVVDSAGRLLPHFISVYNAGKEAPVREGNEWVLVARFNDAKFFYDEDMKQSLDALVPRLERILFQQKLGTLLMKTSRLGSLSTKLAQALDWDEEKTLLLQRSAYLCKADLASQMVKEVPELQGIIGREYALQSGEPPEAALAIAEHYQPRTADDSLPGSEIGRALAVLDRIDTLIGYVGLNHLPKSSSDPFGLKRSANSVIEILATEPDYPTLTEWVRSAHDEYRESGVGLKPLAQVQSDLRGLFYSRLEAYLESQNIRYDLARAVLHAGWDDSVYAVVQRAFTLQNHAQEPEFERLTTTATRPANILSAAEKKGIRVEGSLQAVNPDLLESESEWQLYHALQSLSQQVEANYSLHRFEQLYQSMQALEAPVNRLFDEVMVMCEDEDLRRNRLTLLACANRLYLALADFTQVVQAGE